MGGDAVGERAHSSSKSGRFGTSVVDKAAGVLGAARQRFSNQIRPPHRHPLDDFQSHFDRDLALMDGHGFRVAARRQNRMFQVVDSCLPLFRGLGKNE